MLSRMQGGATLTRHQSHLPPHNPESLPEKINMELGHWSLLGRDNGNHMSSLDSTLIGGNEASPSSLGGGVTVDQWKVRAFTPPPSGDEATLFHGVNESQVGAILRHRSPSQSGRYQWRPVGEPEFLLPPSNNEEHPPPEGVGRGRPSREPRFLLQLGSNKEKSYLPLLALSKAI